MIQEWVWWINHEYLKVFESAIGSVGSTDQPCSMSSLSVDFWRRVFCWTTRSSPLISFEVRSCCCSMLARLSYSVTSMHSHWCAEQMTETTEEIRTKRQNGWSTLPRWCKRRKKDEVDFHCFGQTLLLVSNVSIREIDRVNSMIYTEDDKRKKQREGFPRRKW